MIGLEEIGVSAGYGLVDLGLELSPTSIGGYDAKDIVRLAATFGGYVANYMGYYPKITEVLFYSSLPLTIKTVYSYIKGMTASTKVAKRGYGLTMMPPSPTARKKLEFVGIR